MCCMHAGGYVKSFKSFPGIQVSLRQRAVADDVRCMHSFSFKTFGLGNRSKQSQLVKLVTSADQETR